MGSNKPGMITELDAIDELKLTNNARMDTMY